MKLILKKKDGYVLAWVICLFIIVALLSTVVVSSSIIVSRSTAAQYDTQQSYFTARSAAASVADYIIKNSTDSTAIDSLINNQGSGSIPNMGDYTVDVTYASTSKIKISVTATYKSETSIVSAYLIKPPAPSGIIPTDNVIFLNGSGATGFGQCQLNGDIFVDGNFNLSQGSDINGFVVVKGTTSITGAGNSTTGLFSYGNVYMGNSGTVYGDLKTNGDLKMDGGSYVQGNAYADGSLDMTSGSSRIGSNAVIGKNASFSGGGNRIGGTLTYGGTLSCGWGSVTSFVPMGATKNSNYTPVDSSPYTAQPLPTVSTPTVTQMPELYNPVVITNNVISSSGTLTPAVVALIKQKTWGSTILIDARTKDINLLLNNTALDLGNGINIEAVSDGIHNVYIYMTGSSSISIRSNEYFGMQVRSANPRIFIFGDGTQSVNLYNNSELDACIYIPNGSFSASGSELETYKFVGACIVKGVNIQSNVLLHHSKPDLEGTPLAIFLSDQYTGSKNAWKIESWSN